MGEPGKRKSETMDALAEIYGPPVRVWSVLAELVGLPALVAGVCALAAQWIGVTTAIVAAAILSAMLPVTRAVQVIKKLRAAPDEIRDVIKWMETMTVPDAEWEETNCAHLFWNYWPSLVHGMTLNAWAAKVTGDQPPADGSEWTKSTQRFLDVEHLLVYMAAQGLFEPDRSVPYGSPDCRYAPTDKAHRAFKRISDEPAFARLRTSG